VLSQKKRAQQRKEKRVQKKKGVIRSVSEIKSSLFIIGDRGEETERRDGGEETGGELVGKETRGETYEIRMERDRQEHT
jgi:hypothetical protein